MPPEAVIDIVSLLSDDDRAFVVGGQALNLWAEHYAQSAPELHAFRPFTSKDIDYFGQKEVAIKLANALNGKLRLPDIGDATFQTAAVEAEVNGVHIQIDFLNHVLGISRGIEAGVVDLIIPYTQGGAKATVTVRLMHPLHCLQSRVANIIKLRRTDEIARRQAEAAPIVLRAFIADALADGDQQAATDTLQALFKYLRRDYYGRDAHKILSHDPLEIIRHFSDDERIDTRYRSNNMVAMLAEVARHRNALLRMIDRLFSVRKPDLK